MHVAVDSVGTIHGGGLEVTRRVLAVLQSDPRVSRMTVFASPESGLVEGGKATLDHQPAARRPAGRVDWLMRGFDRAARARQADVALCMTGMATTSLPKVGLIQQALALASGASLERRFAMRVPLWRALLRSSFDHDDVALVQLDWLAGPAEAAVPRAAAVEVIPLGVRAPIRENPASGTGVLHVVSAPFEYKRLPFALDAFALARKTAPKLELTVTARAGGEGVRGLGYVDSAVLEEEYRRAGMLLVTSSVESLGLPVADAMTLGVPIIAPDLPWARSLCDNAALYYEAQSVRDAARAIGEVHRDDVLAADLRRRAFGRAEALWAARRHSRLVDLLGRLS